MSGAYAAALVLAVIALVTLVTMNLVRRRDRVVGTLPVNLKRKEQSG